MVLVDKDIKAMAELRLLINENFSIDNLGSISYDLSVDKIIPLSGDETEKYVLHKGDYVIVKTQEKLLLPYNVLGKIVEKNSVMRMGLFVSGPCYQPGHETYVYARVVNLSGYKICLERGFRIAQIMFEKLLENPEITYDQKSDASFNREIEYCGFGKYEQEYRRKIM